MNTAKAQTYQSGNSTIECVECLPGTKKETNANNVTIACTLMANCKSGKNGKWFNGCSECNDNASWLWTDSDGINFDLCVTNEIPFCLVVKD